MNDLFTKSLTDIVANLGWITPNTIILGIPRSVDLNSNNVHFELRHGGRKIILPTNAYLAKSLRNEIGRVFRVTVENGIMTSYYDPRNGRFC